MAPLVAGLSGFFLLLLNVGSLASAHVISARQTTLQPASNLTLPAQYVNWTYVGCWSDLQGSRTLSAANTAGSPMNASVCIGYCSKKGYVYAGTEYSDECYCGNQLAAASTIQSDSDCNMACSGNSSEACGGPNRLTTYYSNTQVPAGPKAAAPSGWTNYGCWTDIGSRTLANQVQVAGGAANMTSESCTSACLANGYTLAGTEYAQECWCSNQIDSPSASNTTATDCNMPCNGNATEFCGAGNRLSLYAYANSVPAPKTQTVLPAPPSGWFYSGCYNDTVGSRALPNQQFGLGDINIEKCLAGCAAAGYAFAGTEYANECYCASSIQNYAALQSDTSCNMPCKANSNETCGGSGTISIYQLTGWQSIGCYNDTVGRRTLNYEQYGLASMTPGVCTSACKSAGYNISGIEYGGECYCDNAIGNYGALQPSSTCNMACAGDAGSICGGPNALSVYQFNATLLNGVTTGSGGTGNNNGGGNNNGNNNGGGGNNNGGGNGGGNTGGLVSVNSSTIAPFTYQGCYTDASNQGRTLANQIQNNNSLTVESCIAACSAAGYKIAGMEYSTQCFCDNFLRYSPSKVSESQCNMACGGNSSQACGAGSILSVYSNGTMTNYTLPTTAKTIGNWTYQGCITDGEGNRAVPYKLVNETNNSNEGCLALCQRFGYSAGGTEYAQECWCGDIYNVQQRGYQFVDDSQCNMICTNDTTNNINGGSYCGGSGTMSLYQWNGTVPLTNWSFASGDAAGQYNYLINGPIIPLITTPARNGKVTYLEKHGTSPANNATGAYEFDMTLTSNYSAAWREMHVKTDIFCAAGLTLPDKVGRQINVGGWANDATYGVRLYIPDGSPGVAGVNDWEENVEELSLIEGRWYPTAMTMSNGSLLVMGGQVGSNGAPVPTLEVLPSPSGQVLYCDYLERTDPYNLYPYLVVAPSGYIFVAYYNEARLLDPVSLETHMTLPNIPGAVNDPAGGRTYPFEGTAMVLPQSPENNWEVNVIICGGSTPGPEIALDNCVSINPDDPNPEWTIERMPSQRVISCMTALPDGTYLILNGAHQGSAGFGLATDPNLNAVLYDPTKPVHSRMTVMANTTIARLYHSEAVLLDDGSVLVSGSDPEDVRPFAPQEYRNEIYTPPYLMGNKARPGLTLTNLDWSYGQSVSFTVTPSSSSPDTSGYRISMIGSVSSTHGNSMGQRTYFPATSCSGNSCTVTAPPDNKVCPPAWFQVYVLDGNNVPSHATWVRVGGDPAQLGNWPPYDDFTKPGMGAVEPLW